MAEGALLLLYVFVLGTVVGSFANVCIHRLPRGESVVTPPSRCPACGTGIAARDNVPVLGWLLLRGRCRTCRAPISPRYPLVEAALGALFLAGALRWGASAATVAFALLSFASLVLVMTDLESRVLPDQITLVVLGLGLLLAVARDAAGPRPFDLWDSFTLSSVAGAAVGAGFLLLARAVYRMLRGVEGMGMGDVTMIGMIGAFTGPGGILVTLLLASTVGALVGGAAIALQRLLWKTEVARWRAGGAAGLGAGGLLLVDAGGRLASASAGYAGVPGAVRAGQPVAGSRGVARRIAAFVRLARRRAGAGLATEAARVHLDDGADYFRVLSLRAVPVGERLLVLSARTDIPFGVFLAVGALLTLLAGRPLLEALFAGAAPGGKLLP